MGNFELSGKFFAVLLVAVASLSLQSTLMASFYREMDRLSAIAYRGLTLGLTMLPVLFLAAPGASLSVAAIKLILAAIVAASLGNWCAAISYSVLPVGIASALSMSSASVVTVLISFFAFAERLKAGQAALIFLLLAASGLLAATRSGGALPSEYNPLKGALSSLGFGLFIGAAYVLIGAAARQSDPFIAGYLWESGIGIMAAILALSRLAFGGATGLQPIKKSRLFRLALYCSPTAAGTGAYNYAMTIGPIGIASAIVSTLMVCNALLAWPLYGEKLGLRQWLLIVAVCLLVVALRYSSS